MRGYSCLYIAIVASGLEPYLFLPLGVATISDDQEAFFMTAAKQDGEEATPSAPAVAGERPVRLVDWGPSLQAASCQRRCGSLMTHCGLRSRDGNRIENFVKHRSLGSNDRADLATPRRACG